MLVWVVLLLFFVALYVVSSSHDRGSPPSSGWWFFIALAAFIALMVGVVMWNVRIVRRFNAANNVALAALHRGEFATARRTFEQWATAGHKRAALVATHNLGWTMMRQGELESARELLMTNDRQLTRDHAVVAVSALDIALISGLLGELDVATKWLGVVEDRVRGESPDTSFEPMVAFARAVVLCRSGASAEALKMLDERWAEREIAAKGEVMRPLRVVRAFAMATADTRNAGMAEAALQLSKPAYPDEYTFLGRAWPEMRAFLAANNLERT